VTSSHKIVIINEASLGELNPIEIKTYWSDIKKNCKGEVAYHSIEDVRTMGKKDYLATFFFAETMKYFYIAFSQGEFDFNEHVFNTEAHTFKKSDFDPDIAKKRLGY
jgi:hypothetical protein